jgi:hypothetical protein
VLNGITAAEIQMCALLGFLLYFVHVFCRIRQMIKSSKYSSAAVLGCSIASGWIQLILLVILLCGGLIWLFVG